MAIWIAMAVLAAAATIALLAPMARARQVVAMRAAEIAIYRDQLDEIGRDVARGVLPEAEAKAARTEISRRLLKAGDEQEGGGSPGGRSRIAVVAAIVAIPVLSIGGYLALGSPELPDQPIAGRSQEGELGAEIAAMIAQIEQRLAENPDDGTGWEVLGIVYLELGRPDRAIPAIENAIRILGATGDREASLGEAIVMENDGFVTASAQEAFGRSLALDPGHLGARFYLAIAARQGGRNTEAIAAWQDLLADEPPGGAPWGDYARSELVALGVTPPPPPPAVEDDAGVEATIVGMVEGLASRLAQSPDDPQGWAQLIRSYMVLERTDDARAALASARAALAGDPAGLAVVEEEARTRGLQ